ncbi:MAG: hypothetical protein LBS61_03015 [Endomicrobium sp.]|nr:hypothetical protein [Endomicrobium sp.]
MQRKYDKVNKKLIRLYDLQLEGKANVDMFVIKQNELTQEIARVSLKSQLDSLNADSWKAVKKSEETFAVINSVENWFKVADDYEKADILRLIGTGYILDGTEIKPTYRMPFNYLVSAKQNLCAKGVKPPDLKTVFDGKASAIYNDKAKSSNLNLWSGLVWKLYNQLAFIQ